MFGGKEGPNLALSQGEVQEQLGAQRGGVRSREAFYLSNQLNCCECAEKPVNQRKTTTRLPWKFCQSQGSLGMDCCTHVRPIEKDPHRSSSSVQKICKLTAFCM